MFFKLIIIMNLIPFIRANRAITACFILPNNPMNAITLCETISVFGPLLNKNVYEKIIGTLLSMAYNPMFASYYLNRLNESDKIYYRSELILLIILNFYYLFNYVSSHQ